MHFNIYFEHLYFLTGTTTAIVYKGPDTLAKFTLSPVSLCTKRLNPIKLLNLSSSSIESESILDCKEKEEFICAGSVNGYPRRLENNVNQGLLSQFHFYNDKKW